MTDPAAAPALAALVAALLADPPRPIDPDALEAVDQEELAAALRAAVADLPLPEQRTRLAAAFRALSLADAGGVGPGSGGTPVPSADPPPAPPPLAPPPPASASPAPGRPGARLVGPRRVGALLATFVVALLGGVAFAAATGDAEVADRADRADRADLAGAAATTGGEPVPILAAIGSGPQPPTPDDVARLLPPDPAAQADRLLAAHAEQPEGFDQPADDDEGEGESESDEADPSAPDDTLDAEPIAGYADGSRIFATGTGTGTGTGTAGDVGTGTSTTGDDADSSTTTAAPSTGAADPGPASGEERPGLVDLCAVDEPPDGCDGVAGTIHLATIEAFRFNFDPQLATEWPACVALGRDLERHEFVFFLETNTLGAFTARYRIAGSGAAFAEVTGSTPDAYRDALDAGTVAQAVTCIVAERPGGDLDPLHLEVDITGVGDGDSGEARFVGELPLDAAPEPDPVPMSRPGRPPVRVEATNASTLRVTVPVGRRGEQAEVRLAPRSPDAPGDECADPAAAVALGHQTSITVRRVDDIVITDWIDERFELIAPETGTYSVCVDWLDDFEPPRNLERASVPVEIRAVPQVELVLAGYEQGRSRGTQPTSLGLSALVGGEVCGGTTLRESDLGGVADRADPTLLCRLPAIPAYLGLVARPTFPGVDDLTQRAIIAVPEPCSPGPVCTSWFLQTVRAPDRTVSGVVVVGLRVAGASGAGTVSIGAEIPHFTAEDEITGPRLDWSHVSATPDPADPSRRVIVRWRSDAPATVSVWASPDGTEPGCPVQRARTTSDVVDGELTIEGLCPAVGYYVSLDLTGADGRTVYDVWNRRTLPRDVSRVYQSARVTTQAMRVEVDYQLTFAETNRTTPVETGVVPERMWLRLPHSWGEGPSHELHYSQYYDGRARFELDCAAPAHFNRAESGIALNVRGGIFHLEESGFAFSTYDPRQIGIFDGGRGRKCPTIYNQANQTQSYPYCRAVIHQLTPQGISDRLSQMLAGEPAVFQATVPMCSPDQPLHRFTATVTVHVREVRTLTGVTG